MNKFFKVGNFQSYPSPCQTPKMELFEIIVNDFQPVTIFAESSILDLWAGPEYASDKKQTHESIYNKTLQRNHKMFLLSLSG